MASGIDQDEAGILRHAIQQHISDAMKMLKTAAASNGGYGNNRLRQSIDEGFSQRLG